MRVTNSMPLGSLYRVTSLTKILCHTTDGRRAIASCTLLRSNHELCCTLLNGLKAVGDGAP
jgi:hypothetical protein